MAVSFDVAVIGGGIAGVSAAVAARLAGARVCLVRAAPGATALANGSWHGPLRAELRAALADAALDFGEVSQPLLHERGQPVRAEFAAAPHVGAVASSETVVCEFAGLPHFNAKTLARLWSRDQPLRAHTIALPDTPAAGWTTSSLAAYLENRPAALLPHLPRDSARCVFPAVLGILRGGVVIEQLAAQGVHAAEALAAAPSLPGWRLQTALDTILRARAITLIAGRARLETRSGARVQSVRAGDEIIHARSFVLATGKFVAGGITAREEFRESVFDLPVWLEQLGEIFTTADALTLTDPLRTERQALLHAGVHTDAQQRPVDRAGDVVYENVFVAGTVRSEWSTAAAGLGSCAEDGWNAGVNARS